jgi:hypothetical protein
VILDKAKEEEKINSLISLFLNAAIPGTHGMHTYLDNQKTGKVEVLQDWYL